MLSVLLWNEAGSGLESSLVLGLAAHGPDVKLRARDGLTQGDA